MARSRDPAAYPQQFFQLLEILRSGRETLEVNCQDERNAYALRREFYAFRSALFAQTRKKEASEIDLTNYRTIIAYQANVVGPIVLFTRKDATPLMKSLEASLADLAAHIPQHIGEADLEAKLKELGYGTAEGQDPKIP